MHIEEEQNHENAVHMFKQHSRQLIINKINSYQIQHNKLYLQNLITILQFV